MSNEMSVGVASLLAKNVSQSAENLASLAPMKYLPQLDIASGTSDLVNVLKLAAAGDWYIAKSTFGPSIMVVPLAYRSEAIWYNKKEKKFLHNLSLAPDAGDLDYHPQWQAFKSKLTETKDIEYQTGIRVLLYLPSTESYCTILCKKTRLQAGRDLWAYGQGRLTELRTFWHQGRDNSWWKFESFPTDEAVIGFPGLSGVYEETIELKEKTLANAFEVFNKGNDIEIVGEEDATFAR